MEILEKGISLCYQPVGNYGVAIILFTLISKVVLLPLSIWVQKNSIKMVKIQPELNEIKIKYYGDKDSIADAQAELMKTEGYNAFASLIPMIIQIVLLIAMISAIKNGMQADGLDLHFFGFLLDDIPNHAGGNNLLIPVFAGITAWLFCIVQNRANVLQENSSPIMQYGTMCFSIALSLYLGFYVQIGVAVYWMASNLSSILVIYLMNWMINPREYVDYDHLQRTQEELKQLDALSTKKRVSKADKTREKVDYKKFFSVENKKLVFYSEGSGFYKYFKGIIKYLLDNSKVVIHYVTSDPQDAIFEMAKEQPRIRAYYIGERKLITLMMKMDADVVVMTMPDLDHFHIKRSYVRKDVEYIFVPHALHSINLMMRTGCVDRFDTVFICGKHQEEEIRRTEAVYCLSPKKLVKCGYPLLDDMIEEYNRTEKEPNRVKRILIAPSWQNEGIMDLCLEDMLDQLKESGYHTILRPHPQYVRHKPEHLDQLIAKYKQYENIEVQIDFSSNSTVFEADLLITDWSGIAYEYAFTTLKPVLFIDTPMKVQNPEYQKIDVVPMNIWMRKEIGQVLNPNQMKNICNVVDSMLDMEKEYQTIIEQYRSDYLYNLGSSADIGAKYIISSLQTKIAERTSKKEKGVL